MTDTEPDPWLCFARTLTEELMGANVYNFVSVKDVHGTVWAQIALAEGNLGDPGPFGWTGWHSWQGRLEVEITDVTCPGTAVGGIAPADQPHMLEAGWSPEPRTPFWSRSIDWHNDKPPCQGVADLVVAAFRDIMRKDTPPPLIMTEWDGYDRGYGFPEDWEL
ncbi:TY-Chap domain-containing protein [Nocardia sp. NPDC055321]